MKTGIEFVLVNIINSITNIWINCTLVLAVINIFVFLWWFFRLIKLSQRGFPEHQFESSLQSKFWGLKDSLSFSYIDTREFCPRCEFISFRACTFILSCFQAIQFNFFCYTIHIETIRGCLCFTSSLENFSNVESFHRSEYKKHCLYQKCRP